MKNKLYILAIFLLATSFAHAQSFMEGFDRFSSKKPAYLTLQNGQKVEGTIEDLDRKKGNISEITLKVNGKKKTFAPEEIKEMYLPASGLDKFSKQMEVGTNLSKDLKSERVSEGYGYFEFTEVEMKGKIKPLLMQLVNIGFENKIKVYFDPFARETVSVGYGPLKVGGLDRSYYVKQGDKPAYKITKSNYEEWGTEAMKDCPEAVKTLVSNSWNKLHVTINTHANCK